jgi:3-isopropylmalate/(R)-2-methylmalate dehydratase small subunit
MENAKRVKISGTAVPLRGNDIDTDRIIPARFLKTVVFDGLGEHSFEDDRNALREAGSMHPFDDPRFAGARVLLVNKNFGCGSSREHAPQALLRWGKGIAALVGESFAEIFFGNCVALGIPCLVADARTLEALQAEVEGRPAAEFVVDLESSTVTVGKNVYAVSIPEGPKQQFLEGTWDSTAELLAAKPRIEKLASEIDYFRGYA